MKKNTKTKIIESSSILFNKNGYTKVSMRDIASEVGISVGNLTYHYPKKSDLIKSVIKNQHSTLFAIQTPEDLQQLNMFFHRIIDHQKRNNYYLRHYFELSKNYPDIYDVQSEILQKIYDIFYQAFFNLQSSGLINPEEIADQYNGIVQSLMTTCVNSTVNLNSNIDDSSNVLKNIWSVMHLVLTPKGKEIYKNEIILMI